MKILFGTGEGLGNIVHSTPAIWNMKQAGHQVDVVCTATSPGASAILANPKIVSGVLPGIPYGRSYDVTFSTDYCLHQVGNRVRRKEVCEPEWEYNLRAAHENVPGIGSEAHFWGDYDSDAVSCEENTIVICPGCKADFWIKRYPYYYQLAAKLEDYGYKVLFTGIGNELIEYRNRFRCEGHMAIRQTGNLLKTAKAVIANDNGLMHYAAALGTKTFGIFGPSSKKKNLPPTVKCISINLIHSIKDKVPECFPCQETKLMSWLKKTCEYECYSPLTPEIIFNEIQGELIK